MARRGRSRERPVILRSLSRAMNGRSPLRSIVARLVLVTVLFAAGPAVVYQQFRMAEEERTALLLGGVADQGRAIAEALRPILEEGDPVALSRIGDRMAPLAGAQVALRLLFRPSGAAVDSFLLVAAVPPLPAGDLEDERRFLIRSRLLEAVWRSCDETEVIGQTVTPFDRDAPLIVAVTPVQTPNGCWALVTSLSASEALARTLSAPYWQRPEVLLALGLYLALASVILLILLSVSRNLVRFERLARSIAAGREGDRRFEKLNEVPELTDVARQFAAMVDRLRRSASAVRETAEESAHALKTPIGAIRQSLEPLRTAVPAEDRRGRRAIDIIDQCCERLSQLVVEARRAIELAALMAHPPSDRIDLGAIVVALVEGMRGPSDAASVRLTSSAERGAVILGSEDSIDAILENLIDNAIGFSPADGVVGIAVRVERQEVVLTVCDDGPGIVEASRDRLFEKGYSHRPKNESDPDAAARENFGMGLWIVRRNVDAMGGTVTLSNRVSGGLAVEIRFPLAP